MARKSETDQRTSEGADCTLAAKADFTHVYDEPDPRGYFCTLSALDYEIPQQAWPVFQALLSALRANDSRPGGPEVLDLCCSYGVNAALLRCDVTMDDMCRRYSDPRLAGLSSDELRTSDARYYAERCRPNAPSVSGLDTAGNAIAYARQTGLLAQGWAEDLETRDPSPSLAEALGRMDLITTTGGVGYITERTFDRVVGTREDDAPPWVASFVLRMVSYDRISDALAQRGLVTEQLPGVTFPQRRFASQEERDAALDGVQERGLDPTGREAAGRYHADFYLSRPAADAARQPLEELLAGVVPR